MVIRYDIAAAPTNWGDVATAAGAIASFLVVLVALIPIFRAWSAQKKRARVSAAQLYAPFEQLHSILKNARPDFDIYVNGQRSSPNPKFERLAAAFCDTAKILATLEPRFADSLPGKCAKALASGMCQAKTLLARFENSYNHFLDTPKERQGDPSVQADITGMRRHAAMQIAYLGKTYDSALSNFDVVLSYCRKALCLPPDNFSEHPYSWWWVDHKFN